MMKFSKSSVTGLMITILFVGLIWGVIRIELILLVPYFYLVDFFFDVLVYSYSGYRFGQIIGRYHFELVWFIVILPLLFYAGDRLLSPRLILGTAYSGRTETTWRIIIEFLIVILAITFAWKGRLSQREIAKTK